VALATILSTLRLLMPALNFLSTVALATIKSQSVLILQPQQLLELRIR
jgi:hypothetical protein